MGSAASDPWGNSGDSKKGGSRAISLRDRKSSKAGFNASPPQSKALLLRKGGRKSYKTCKARRGGWGFGHYSVNHLSKTN